MASSDPLPPVWSDPAGNGQREASALHASDQGGRTAFYWKGLIPHNEWMLRVAEIFASVQGEGMWVGVPSTFVRVSGCNLRCVWCDTPYASWRPEGAIMSVGEILSEVERHQLRHVVLTGGEPMLFEPIEELAAMLHEDGRKITVETAGTLYRRLPCDLMSISPKLSDSTPTDTNWQAIHNSRRIQVDTLRRLVSEYPYQLKFVVNPDEGDRAIVEIDDLLAQLPALDPERVLLMPEGTDSETLHRRGRALVETCLARNWRLTPRLHIDLFGNTKGT